MVEEVEVETQNASKPSSPHANFPNDPQCTQSSIGDAQTMSWSQPDVDPFDPQYVQTSIRDAQAVKWN